MRRRRRARRRDRRDDSGVGGSGRCSAEAVQHWLLAALDEATDAIVVVDRIGREVVRNAPARRFDGARTARCSPRTRSTSSLQRRARRASLRSASSSSTARPARCCSCASFPLRRDGEVVGAVAFTRDVSEARRVESVRRDFVANVSHELKTPIGALGLLAETMAATDDPAVVQQLADRVVREADRLSRIVDDLLDLSQIEAQEAPSRARRCRCGCCSPRRSTSCRPRPTSPRCRSSSRPKPPDIEIACDRRQMRSALDEPARQRDQVLRARSSRSRSARASSTTASRSSCAITASGSRPAISSGSSSASTGSTGRAAATPAAPGSGSRSSATSPRRTAAKSPSSRARAKARRSRSTCRSRTARGSRPMLGGLVMADPPLILVVDDEQSYRDALVVALATRGLPRRDRGRRPGGDRAFRRDPARARAARRDAAQDLRHRRVPRSAVAFAGPDHHGHRAELRDRRGGGARGRRRRLRDEAVPPARADRARARRAAAGSGVATTTSPTVPRCSRSATSGSTPAATRCSCAASRSRCRSRSSSCSSC